MSAIAQPVHHGEGAVKQKINQFQYMMEVFACASAARCGMSVVLVLIKISIMGPLFLASQNAVGQGGQYALPNCADLSLICCVLPS